MLALPEQFLHFIWQYRLLDIARLNAYYEDVTIIDLGKINYSSGPDFTDAKVRIGETIWVGNIEMHIRNKDWFIHQHHRDKAYNNVILHVIWTHDKNDSITLENGRQLRSIAIQQFVFPQVVKNYHQLMNNDWQKLPCLSELQKIHPIQFTATYESLVFERLNRKIAMIQDLLNYFKGDIEHTFIALFFQYFGAPINQLPFDQLAKSFTLRQFKLQQISQQQLASFLFGLAGLLSNKDTYSQKLLNEFIFTSKKYKINNQVDTFLWRFKGNRPANFPSIRIAQLAALFSKEKSLFSKLIASEEIEDIYKLLEIELDEYWNTHYNFGTIAKKKSKRVSKSFKNRIIINVLVPFLFFYSNMMNEGKWQAKALRFLNELPMEVNAIIKAYQQFGFTIENAFDTQAILTLHKNYCTPKKCLNCKIGYSILQKDNVEV